MRHPHLFAVALALCVITASYERAIALRVTLDLGGSLYEYAQKYIAIRLSGEKVVIDGMCVSACTLVTALVPDEQVCVTPYARLAFHSAHVNGVYHPEGTRFAWHLYPQKIRDLLKQRGWSGETEQSTLIYVEGDELLSLYRACTPQDLKGQA